MTKTSLAPSPSAQQLADALRAGVAARRRLTEEDEGEDAARLRELGDLEGLPPVAKPGVAAPVIKAVRRVLRGFLRPWLAAQTIVNRETARRFQGMLTGVRDLERRVPGIEQSVQHLEARILQIERERTTDAPPGRGVAEEDAVASVERMFVQSRLPRPPARVRMLGSSAGLERELTAFGFDVVTGAAAHREASGRGFDVAVCLTASLAASQTEDAYRTLIEEAIGSLAPGGRLMLSRASTEDEAVMRAASTIAGTLRIAEALVGRHDRGHLSVAPWDPEVPPPADAAFVLIDARDVPGR
jgi:hypothetical protein